MRGGIRSRGSGPTIATSIAVSTIAVVVALVVSALAVTGYLPQGFVCRTAPGVTESIGGRTYCAASVPWLSRGGNTSASYTANYTEWGVEFHLILPPSSGFVLVISVTEPFDAILWGSISLGGGGFVVCNGPPGGPQTSCYPPENPSSPAWFTPNSTAGIMFSAVPEFPPTNLTLLVKS